MGSETRAPPLVDLTEESEIGEEAGQVEEEAGERRREEETVERREEVQEEGEESDEQEEGEAESKSKAEKLNGTGEVVQLREEQGEEEEWFTPGARATTTTTVLRQEISSATTVDIRAGPATSKASSLREALAHSDYASPDICRLLASASLPGRAADVVVVEKRSVQQERSQGSGRGAERREGSRSLSPSPEDSVSRTNSPTRLLQQSSRTPKSHERIDRWSRRGARRERQTSCSFASPRTSFSRVTLHAKTPLQIAKEASLIVQKHTNAFGSSTVNLEAKEAYIALLNKYSGADFRFSSNSSQPSTAPRNRHSSGMQDRPLKRLSSTPRGRPTTLAARKSLALSALDELAVARKRPEEEQTPHSAVNPSETPEEASPTSYFEQQEEEEEMGTLSRQSSSSNSGRTLLDIVSRIDDLHLRKPLTKIHHEAYKRDQNYKQARASTLEEESHLREVARLSKQAGRCKDLRAKLQLQGIFVPLPKPKENEFPELPEEAIMLCDKIWQKGRDPNEKFGENSKYVLTRNDLITLRSLNWLNDEAYTFNTFFYTNISTKGYASVKRWTRNVDIFSYDILLVPVHLGQHWCMAVIDLSDKSIDYYDSLGANNVACLEHLKLVLVYRKRGKEDAIPKEYLRNESRDKKKEEISFSGWCFQIRKDIPQQQNGSDCGVFSCKFADFAARRKEVTFDQSHMPYYRKRMVWQLVQGKL